jgi:outer membrane cobalamin receptor
VTLGGGLRLADSTLVHQGAVDRWLQAEWSPGRWLLHGSIGVMHQFPAFEQIQGWGDALPLLRPERARHADVGIGQRLSASLRWDATVFLRREGDVLREPDGLPRLVDGELVAAGAPNRFENALTGSARGIELTIERRSQTDVSGWIGYSYGVARSTDTKRLETYAADFDQRHALNLAGTAALPWETRMGVTFRTGTNFPIPGYLVARDDRLFAGERRNAVRLPAYARLDLRAERTFDHGGRRFTLFAETLNVLNRMNLGLADGAITPGTGEAVGFTGQRFGRLVTVGVRFEF